MGMALVEPAIVPDIFCSGLADAEDLGDGLFRFTFYAKQRSIFDNHEECVVVARIVMSGPAAYAGSTMSLKAISGRCWSFAGMLLAH